jgi:HTH-type transcriptional repressor of NAD biosynthesis genes
MGKQFKKGLIVGKFLPFHNGHKYLIDTARANCDEVIVLVCHIPTEPISGEDRYKMLSHQYHYPSSMGNSGVTVKSVDTSDIPQYESDCDTLDEFYEPWVKFVAEHAPDIDSVFTSEDYGDDFARYLGVEHYLVDKERTTYPISGTEVRADLFGKWGMLPLVTRRIMQVKVAILGTESTGKSTLVDKLWKHYNEVNITTTYQPEYGRTYAAKKLGDDWSKEDFEKIAIRHNNQYRFSRLVGDVHQLAVLDTEAVITNAFGQLYLGEDFQSDVIDQLIANQDFHKYVLLDIDVPWVDDGTREFPHKRAEHMELIKKNLDRYGIDYEVVSGDYDERFEKTLKIIDNLLALSK